MDTISDLLKLSLAPLTVFRAGRLAGTCERRTDEQGNFFRRRAPDISTDTTAGQEIHLLPQ